MHFPKAQRIWHGRGPWTPLDPLGGYIYRQVTESSLGKRIKWVIQGGLIAFYVWATVCWVCRLRDQHQAYMKIRLVKFTYIDQQINQLDIDKYKDEYVQTYVHDIHKYIKHTSVNTGTYVDAYLPTYLHACIQQNKEIDQYVVYIEYT